MVIMSDRKVVIGLIECWDEVEIVTAMLFNGILTMMI
jgi:hypothetical protein